MATTLLPATANAENNLTDELSDYTPEERQQLEQLEKEVAAYEKNMEILKRKPLVVDVKNRQRARIGSWSWRDGVICLTDGGKQVAFVNSWHAAIVVPQWYYAVVEAGPDNGVFQTTSPNSDAKNNQFLIRYESKQVWQVGIKGTTVQQDWKAGEWAGKQVGKPYNKNVFGDIRRTDKFYCSQLVWAAYYYTCGYDLDMGANNSGNGKTWRIHPKEILDHPGTAIIYRKR